jgi:hypothetical protein
MKLVLRREVFQVDTFTALMIEWLGHRIQISHERGRKENDLAFHVAREFGGKN